MKLHEIAARLGCELRGDGEIEIHGIAPIESAEPATLTFIANTRYRSYLSTTRASAVILDQCKHAPHRDQREATLEAIRRFWNALSLRAT